MSKIYKIINNIAEITHHDKGWVSNLLKENGIDGKDIVERSQAKKTSSNA